MPRTAERARRTATATLLAGLLLVAVSVAGCSGRPPEPQPLRMGDPDEIATSSITIGDSAEVAFGANLMVNTGASPITDIRATLVGSTDRNAGGERIRAAAVQVTMRPAEVVEVGKETVALLGAGLWPTSDLPQRLAKPLSGYTLRPGHLGVELLFTMSVRGPGFLRWARTVVHYRYLGRQYTRDIPNGFEVCSSTPSACH